MANMKKKQTDIVTSFANGYRKLEQLHYHHDDDDDDDYDDNDRL